MQLSLAGAVELSHAGLLDRETIAAFLIQLGLKAAVSDVEAGGDGAGGHLGAVGGGGGRVLGASDSILRRDGDGGTTQILGGSGGGAT
jgi:hypothetical protein